MSDFQQIDRLALRKTFIHRIDPRAKVVTTLAFIVCIVSFEPHAFSALLPFLLFPAVMIGFADLPFSLIARKTLYVLPFALMIGMFNPILDGQILMKLGPLEISRGWISLASILLRAILTASAAIILVATTGFPTICSALTRIRVPRIFVMQLQFLYRYIFVLAEEANRTMHARKLRSFGRQGLGIRPFCSLAGHLLLRTLARAERVQLSMAVRGFASENHASNRIGHFGRPDLMFTCGWIVIFILLRTGELPYRFGAFLLGVFT